MPHDSLALQKTLYGQAERPSSRPWIWFLDFDGTLVDIAPHPNAVHLAPNSFGDLIHLAAAPFHSVAIVSGRPLSDLSRYFPSPNGLWLSGDHGAEVKGPNSFIWRHSLHLSIQHDVKMLTSDLKNRLAHLAGVWVEPKPTSISIHYRQASEPSITQLKQIIQAFPWQDQWTVRSAQQCYEVRHLRGPNKADAVRVIRQFVDPLNISLCLAWGDDVTDEDMFLAVPQGITVKVGLRGSDTHARYQVDSAATVRRIIQEMAQYWTR